MENINSCQKREREGKMLYIVIFLINACSHWIKQFIKASIDLNIYNSSWI